MEEFNNKNSNSNSEEYKGGKRNKPTKSKVALPSQTNNSPPWQVLSPKAAKLHAAALKERREAMARGEEDPGVADHQELKIDMNNNRFLSDADRKLLTWKRFNPLEEVGGMGYVGSYLGTDKAPTLGVPEVAFLGRSNVGKSSLLNKLLALTSPNAGGNSGGIGGASVDKARVGKTPGATASVNMYALVSKRNKNMKESKIASSPTSNNVPILGMVDLPGFGYAKLSKDRKERVEQAAERYLADRKELGLAILLVDARRTPSEDDRAVLAALFDLGVPLCVVATKVDKLNKNQVEPALQTIQQGLGLPPGQPLTISNISGEGVKELWTIIMDACATRVEELLEDAESGGKKSAADARDIGANNNNENDNDGDVDEDFDDGEDLVYDQGYDWIHGVKLEEEEVYEDDEFYIGEEDEDDDNDNTYG
jgi:GTP-binding protein